MKMRNYDELPKDIIFDIMWRVPVKSVGLCRCVSKQWLALLSQPNFIKTHLQVTKFNSLESLVITDSTDVEPVVYLAPLDNAHQLFDEITLSLSKLSFYNPPLVSCLYISCDGLLLAITYRKMVLMNPTTREIRQLPPSPPAVHDNVSTFFWYGFCYDSVTDDYKIVIISLCHGRENGSLTNATLFDVYSLKIGCWKRLESSTYNYFGGLGLSADAFVGGCLHWLHTRPTDDKVAIGPRDDKVAIAAFDLVEGKFREVPLPSSILDNLGGVYVADLFPYKLGVLEGCLCISYATEEYAEVWVMKEYGVSKSWTKFMVNQPFGVFECFLNDQEQVVMRIYDDNHVLWNPKQGTSKKIVLNGFSGHSKDLHVETTFVESLVSPFYNWERI